ncbi:MAG TPA: polysaccharide deacetylase family protein [Actinospica sp.]|nr:polysaccharide deacetylase family protein [Actinospica sp.]
MAGSAGSKNHENAAGPEPSVREPGARFPAALMVSVHDVAPGTAAQSLRWIGELDRRGVPATLLLVPGPWRGPLLSTDGRLADVLLAAESRGHELALHGYYHRATHGAGALWRRGVAQALAPGAAEFATLSQDEARARIEAGLDELAALGIEPVGFHPPGWLINPESIRALRRSGLRYYTTHLGVHTLVHSRPSGIGAAGEPRQAAGELRLAAPALSHRPGGHGEQLGARLMAQAARRLAHRGRALRIALHPDDLSRPNLRDVALRAVDDALAAGARPVTYAEALGLPRTARRVEHTVAERIVDWTALERTAERIALTAAARDVEQALP